MILFLCRVTTLIVLLCSRVTVEYFQFAEIAISPDIAHLCGSQGFPGINGEIRQNLNFNHSLRIRIQIVLNSVFEIIIMFISHRLNIRISCLFALTIYHVHVSIRQQISLLRNRRRRRHLCILAAEPREICLSSVSMMVASNLQCCTHCCEDIDE